jgi:hypothetical protein
MILRYEIKSHGTYIHVHMYVCRYHKSFEHPGLVGHVSCQMRPLNGIFLVSSVEICAEGRPVHRLLRLG